MDSHEAMKNKYLNMSQKEKDEYDKIMGAFNKKTISD